MSDARRSIVRSIVLTSVVVLLAGCGLVSHVTRDRNRLPEFTNEPGAWTTTWVPMRDGLRLHTRILLPRGHDPSTPAPLVLIRNAYPYPVVYETTCDMVVRYGIGCVVQDVRGRGRSEGDWHPFMHEVADGRDLLDWVLAQPFAGDVALFGVSYLGATALATAAAGPLPDRVKTLVVTAFGTDFAATLGERGLLHHELVTAWAAFMPGREPAKDAGKAYREALETYPHLEADERAFGRQLPWYRAWLDAAQGPDAALWQTPESQAVASLPEKLDVPVLLFAGFDDPFLTSMLSTWSRLRSRDRSLLVLNPTNHLGMQSGAITARDLPAGQPPPRESIPWLLHHLNGAPPPLPTGVVVTRARQDPAPLVRPAWPPPTTPTVLALSDAPLAGERCPSRALATDAGEPGRASYVYDPNDPWRIHGSARGIAFVLPGMNGVRPGPVELPWECARADVLRFAAEPLTAPMRLAGRAELVLTVRSNAPDTAFAAKLVDIDPNGRAFHVSDGIATLRRPTAADTVDVPYERGTERRVVIDLFPNEWLFQPGHRVGVWVSSSIFPTFTAHPNTEVVWYRATEPLRARQSVVLGGDASMLVLPVVTEQGGPVE